MSKPTEEQTEEFIMLVGGAFVLGILCGILHLSSIATVGICGLYGVLVASFYN